LLASLSYVPTPLYEYTETDVQADTLTSTVHDFFFPTEVAKKLEMDL